VKKLSLRITILFALCACGKSADRTAPAASDTVVVAFPGGTVAAQIAATRAARETGLMNRPTLGTDSGMLFVFPSDQQAAFWMKSTEIPLSIAFMDAAQRVLDVQEMAPFDTVNLHRPALPYRYALEANKGWFTAHGVAAGVMATFSLPSGTVITP
jgi:uncharacterized membrane protein (UPF0127 family)